MNGKQARGMARWTGTYVVERDGAVVLHVHVQPSAGRSGVVGRHGDAVKVRVAAPPVDDRANVAVIALVAAIARVPPASVRIVGGARSRAKRVRIDGVDPGYLSAAIEAAVASRP